MLPDHKMMLMTHRLGSAKEKLESAKLLLDNGKLKDSIGRSYYAMFTSVRALLARDGVDFSKHAGVISYFQKEYIKTGVLEVKYSKFLSKMFHIYFVCMSFARMHVCLPACLCEFGAKGNQKRVLIL